MVKIEFSLIIVVFCSFFLGAQEELYRLESNLIDSQHILNVDSFDENTNYIKSLRLSLDTKNNYLLKIQNILQTSSKDSMNFELFIKPEWKSHFMNNEIIFSTKNEKFSLSKETEYIFLKINNVKIKGYSINHISTKKSIIQIIKKYCYGGSMQTILEMLNE